MVYSKRLFILFLSLFALFGCSSSSTKSDPNAPEQIRKFNYEDPILVYQELAEKLTDSLLSSPIVREIVKERKPTVIVDRMTSKSAMHIDTERLDDIIRKKLLDSDAFHLYDPLTVMEYLRKETNSDSESADLSDLTYPPDIDFFIRGNVSSAEMGTRRNREIQYEMSLTLTNVTTEYIEWMDSKKTTRMYTK